MNVLKSDVGGMPCKPNNAIRMHGISTCTAARLHLAAGMHAGRTTSRHGIHSANYQSIPDLREI